MAKLCPKCGEPLDANGFCEACNLNISVYNKIKDTSKVLYNQGLQKAKVRDLSGAIDLLNRSIRLDKDNIDARNLLGLVFFELGETVSALQHWVISKNLKQDDNDAIYFINKIQNNQSYLDKLNTAIKKYNQSLTYIEQNSIDLAIIQLKKVISLNSNFVKAYCLLALCYYREKQLDKAKKTLLKIFAIDKSNYVARKYLDALAVDSPSSDDFAEPLESDKRIFQGPSLSSKKFNVNSALFQFVAMLVGVGIGLSVMMFLVMPSRIQEKEDEKNVISGKVKDLEATRSDLESEIAKLTTSITDKDSRNGELSSDISSMETELEEVTKLVKAFEYYAVEEMTEAADVLHEIDQNLLDEQVQIVYTTLTTEIYPAVAYQAWLDGYDDYRLGRHEDGIVNLETAFKYEQADFYSDETLYFLARCHQKLGNDEEAIKVFEKLLEEYPEGTDKIINDAGYYLRVLTN